MGHIDVSGYYHAGNGDYVEYGIKTAASNRPSSVSQITLINYFMAYLLLLDFCHIKKGTIQ